MTNIRNPFLEEHVESCTFFIKSMKIKELSEIVYCPLWKISHVNYNGSCFHKNWYDNGIRNIMDIINEKGIFVIS